MPKIGPAGDSEYTDHTPGAVYGGDAIANAHVPHWGWWCAWTQPVPGHCPGVLYRGTASGYTGMGARRIPRGEENTAMRLTHQWWSGLVAAVLGGLVGVT